MIGEVVGSYRITEKIATGGMGVIFKAEHQLIGKTVAVKILRKEYSENRGITDRFFNEAKATTSIRHPGIVDIYDYGYYQNERAYIVMEYLEGETLKSRLRSRGVFSPEVACQLICRVASAVGAAHQLGIIHRDLKPDNIHLVADPDMPGGERVKVLDFGLAKLTNDRAACMGTQVGIVLGTPSYMAPEQCSGLGKIDHRADIYAMGCILFQLVCGRPPFRGEGVAGTLAAHLNAPPPAPRGLNSAVSVQLEQVILKLLAKSPDERFQTMDELQKALEVTIAAPVSEEPETVMEEPDTQLMISSPHHVPPSGEYLSTLEGSAGQILDSHPPLPGLPPRRMPSTHDSQSGSLQVSQSQLSASSRVSIARWFVGGAVSVLVGMLIVFAAMYDGDGPTVSALPPADSVPVVTPVAAQTTPAVAEHTGDSATAVPSSEAGAVPSEPSAASPDEGAEQTATGNETGVAVATGAPENSDTGTDSNGTDSAQVATAVTPEAEAAAVVPEAAAPEAIAAAGAGSDEDEVIEMAPDVLEKPSERTETVRIRLRTQPANATIKLGRIARQQKVLVLEKNKKYRIAVSAPGYESKSVWVQADRDRALTIKLKSKRIDLDL